MNLVDQIVRDLFSGNYTAFEPMYQKNSAYANALDEVLRIGREFEQKAPVELMPLFQAYSEACSKLSNIACEEEYLHGYRIGAQFMLAVFPQTSFESKISP